MRFSVQHGVGDPAWTPAVLSPRAVTAFARAVEGAGYNAVGFTDHPAPSASWLAAGGEGSSDPFTSLAFCAAVTERIRLLTFVIVLAYRNPFVAAHQLATLDHLSAGRLTIGAGTGYLKAELFAVGADPARRLAAFDEAWATMTEVWSGEPVTRTAEGFSARGTRMPLVPLQAPHPPLWVHGNSPWGRERAARHGQGCLFIVIDSPELASTIRTTPVPDTAALARAVEDLHTRVAAAGRPRVDVIVTPFPMLDVRRGWDSAAVLETMTGLAAEGVDEVVVNVCGDDPVASVETALAFAETVGIA
jgi:probable F420-dependent oxidoreductase